MNTLILALAVVTFISTLTGGLLILRFRNSLPYFFAFSAGSLVAVAFLELVPEAIKIAGACGSPIRYLMVTIVASFFFYSILEKFFLSHDVDDNHHGHILGPIGAGSLVIHSFFDGAAIGAAFQVSPSVGLVVALAIISHDLTDGINTVTVMLKNRHKSSDALKFLFLDAVAPFLGIVVTSFIAIPPAALAILLSIFVGEFLYIGAVNLLPETHKYNAKKVIFSMAAGMLIILVLSSVI